MTVPEKYPPPPSVQEAPEDRAQRIAELKRQVEAGTYLIQRYEIIEGLLDALAQDAG